MKLQCNYKAQIHIFREPCELEMQVKMVYQVRAEAIIHRLHRLTGVVEVDRPLVTAGFKGGP